jgi:hypothetical protein
MRSRLSDRGKVMTLDGTVSAAGCWAWARTMPMRGALANPGEGVVGCVRLLTRLLRRTRPRGRQKPGSTGG